MQKVTIAFDFLPQVLTVGTFYECPRELGHPEKT